MRGAFFFTYTVDTLFGLHPTQVISGFEQVVDAGLDFPHAFVVNIVVKVGKPVVIKPKAHATMVAVLNDLLN